MLLKISRKAQNLCRKKYLSFFFHSHTDLQHVTVYSYLISCLYDISWYISSNKVISVVCLLQMTLEFDRSVICKFWSCFCFTVAELLVKCATLYIPAVFLAMLFYHLLWTKMSCFNLIVSWKNIVITMIYNGSHSISFIKEFKKI